MGNPSPYDEEIMTVKRHLQNQHIISLPYFDGWNPIDAFRYVMSIVGLHFEPDVPYDLEKLPVSPPGVYPHFAFALGEVYWNVLDRIRRECKNKVYRDLLDGTMDRMSETLLEDWVRTG